MPVVTTIPTNFGYQGPGPFIGAFRPLSGFGQGSSTTIIKGNKRCSTSTNSPMFVGTHNFNKKCKNNN